VKKVMVVGYRCLIFSSCFFFSGPFGLVH
jgi:hypothetical protein